MINVPTINTNYDNLHNFKVIDFKGKLYINCELNKT